MPAAGMQCPKTLKYGITRLKWDVKGERLKWDVKGERRKYGMLKERD